MTYTCTNEYCIFTQYSPWFPGRQSMPPALSIQHVWRADQLGAAPARTLATGNALFDRELPGSGWPGSSLIELLPQQAGLGELRLLQPALRRIPAARPIALIQPPHMPQIAAWANWGLPVQQLLWIKAARSADALWSAEQILRNGSCGALLLWQPHMRHESLRRLHLAAQASDMLCWLLRPLSAAREASPAPLRLCLYPAPGGMEITFLKRRGPPRDEPLFVPLAHMPVQPISQAHHAHLDRHPSALPAARSPAPTLV
jgi:protein ImuA